MNDLKSKKEEEKRLIVENLVKNSKDKVVAPPVKKVQSPQE